MHVKVVVHDAEEGGFWGEVPALPGCASQGETMDELLANLREAIAGWLEADSTRPTRAGANGSSTWPCEARLGTCAGPRAGAEGLATPPRERQPSYLGKTGERARLSIPCHGARPLKSGLQRHLMKVAGVDELELD
jgi:predicted RNase H-like HicB family nuclease